MVVMVSEMGIEIEMLVCLALIVMGNMYGIAIALRRVVIRSARETQIFHVGVEMRDENEYEVRIRLLLKVR
jgi:hypothetical protein